MTEPTSVPPPGSRVVVLVEGESDAVVVRGLTQRYRLDVTVVAMGGITNVRQHVARCREDRLDVVLVGVCDEQERRFMEKVEPPLEGIFVCERDLEDELIRAVGPERVLGLLDGLGDLGRFRTFQDQPEWRGQPLHDQLRRFAGTRSGRKAAFAGRLAAELEDDSMPVPLARLLERLHSESQSHPPG